MGTTARECPMEFGKGRTCPSDLVYPDCAVVRVCGGLFRLSRKKMTAPPSVPSPENEQSVLLRSF